MPEITEQLRTYGEAVERALLNGFEQQPVTPRPHVRRIMPALVSIALVIALIAIVGVWIARSDDEQPQVTTDEARSADGGDNAVTPPSGPRGGTTVVVPNVAGETLGSAEAVLTQLGFVAAPFEWDPDDPTAIVVAQEPGPRVAVPVGSRIGLRTALLSEELCSVMNGIPYRDGDAVQTVASEGFVDMLREAEGVADPNLGAAISSLLDHLDGGGTVDTAPPRSIDQITMHYRGCTGYVAP